MIEIPKPWPRLSELHGPRKLGICQSCSGNWKLGFWLEHDEDDKPQPIVVCLCAGCASKLIDPHPRLYRKLYDHEPMPGVMAICEGCVHQSGVTCASPRAQINGGPGLTIKHPQPIRGFLCGRGHKHGKGGCQHLVEFPGPPTACDGRQTMAIL